MQKLIPNRIIRTEISPLTENDSRELTARKNKQLLVILSTYIFIAGFCIYFLMGGTGFMNLDNKSFRIYFSSYETDSFRKAVPYFCGLIFLLTTFFFVKLLVRSIIPLARDIRNGKKSLLFYIPTKSISPALDSYHITTPLYKDQEVEISREAFESIGEKEELCWEIVPNSVNVLRLTKGQKEIKYN